jgi:hypothetical protein
MCSKRFVITAMDTRVLPQFAEPESLVDLGRRSSFVLRTHLRNGYITVQHCCLGGADQAALPNVLFIEKHTRQG